MEKRKIVQLAAAGVEENSSTQCELMVLALCNDGTVWYSDNRNLDRTWFRVADIPQGE